MHHRLQSGAILASACSVMHHLQPFDTFCHPFSTICHTEPSSPSTLCHRGHLFHASSSVTGHFQLWGSIHDGAFNAKHILFCYLAALWPFLLWTFLPRDTFRHTVASATRHLLPPGTFRHTVRNLAHFVTRSLPTLTANLKAPTLATTAGFQLLEGLTNRSNLRLTSCRVHKPQFCQVCS